MLTIPRGSFLDAQWRFNSILGERVTWPKWVTLVRPEFDIHVPPRHSVAGYRRECQGSGRCEFRNSCACIQDNSWMKARVWNSNICMYMSRYNAAMLSSLILKKGMAPLFSLDFTTFVKFCSVWYVWEFHALLLVWRLNT